MSKKTIMSSKQPHSPLAAISMATPLSGLRRHESVVYIDGKEKEEEDYECQIGLIHSEEKASELCLRGAAYLSGISKCFG